MHTLELNDEQLEIVHQALEREHGYWFIMREEWKQSGANQSDITMLSQRADAVARLMNTAGRMKDSAENEVAQADTALAAV